MHKNNIWTYVNKNEVKNKKILTNKWVFRVKDSGKFKARLVIRCQQKYGIDYKETFSPVVSTISIRILFALSVKTGVCITKFDTKTAILYGNLTEEIYIYVPEGYDEDLASRNICRR